MPLSSTKASLNVVDTASFDLKESSGVHTGILKIFELEYGQWMCVIREDVWGRCP